MRKKHVNPTVILRGATILLAILVMACGLTQGRSQSSNQIPQPGQVVVTSPVQLAATEAGSSLANPSNSNPTEPLVKPPVLPSNSGALLCTDVQPPLITGTELFQSPVLAEPQARIPFRDPTFGTCLVRVTDRNVDLATDDDSAGMVNEYSRVQSFNADGTRLIARSTDTNWYLYDAQSLKPLGNLPGVGIDPRWDGTNPEILYYIDGTQLMSYNVNSHQPTLVHEFSANFPGQTLVNVWTRYEGSSSLDSRYWGFMAMDTDYLAIALLTYDKQNDQIIGQRDLPHIEELDSVTISPLGDYFLGFFNYCEQGQLGTLEHPCGLMVYDRTLQNGRGMLRLIGHNDIALDADGKEVLVFQNIDTDFISVLDLSSGQVWDLMPIDFSHSAIGFHFSGRSFSQPGWAVISTYNGSYPQNTNWMDNSIFAVELNDGGRVVRLAHTHSVYTENVEQDYWAEPHASANPDLTRIVFTSNWGRSGTDATDLYMIQLPGGWIETLE